MLFFFFAHGIEHIKYGKQMVKLVTFWWNGLSLVGQKSGFIKSILVCVSKMDLKSYGIGRTQG